MKKFHAATVTGLMAEAGYDQASIDHVQRMILKNDLKKDPDNQVGVNYAISLCLLP